MKRAGILGKYTETTTIPGLFFVSIAVVYADERAAKGECFAEGDEDRVMDLSQWRANKARHQQEASKRAECHCAQEL